MAADDESDAQTLLIATPVYASKNLNVDDLEFDQECTYRKLPGRQYERAVCYHDSNVVTVSRILFTLLSNLTTSKSQIERRFGRS